MYRLVPLAVGKERCRNNPKHVSHPGHSLKKFFFHILAKNTSDFGGARMEERLSSRRKDCLSGERESFRYPRPKHCNPLKIKTVPWYQKETGNQWKLETSWNQWNQLYTFLILIFYWHKFNQLYINTQLQLADWPLCPGLACLFHTLVKGSPTSCRSIKMQLRYLLPCQIWLH